MLAYLPAFSEIVSHSTRQHAQMGRKWHRDGRKPDWIFIDKTILIGYDLQRWSKESIRRSAKKKIFTVKGEQKMKT
ncbi:MAG TPA: hypothetical protein VMW41_06955, partial [Candidatus Bathyarchaeia archaeon]|nr:hypothetical protein [Candidatus Bathyarchaeia archaeon]